MSALANLTKALFDFQDNQVYESPTGRVYINLCPHDLTLWMSDGSVLRFEKPSESAMIARIKQESVGVYNDPDGFVIHTFKTSPPMLYRNIRNEYLDEKAMPTRHTYGDVMYIVSFAVQEAMQRSDILAPHAIRFDSSNRATAWQLKGLV